VTVNGNPATRYGTSQYTYVYSVLPTDPIGIAHIEVSGTDRASLRRCRQRHPTDDFAGTS